MKMLDDMFGFFSMADNYDDRAVDRFEVDGLIIDTAAVTDGAHPYETGVLHEEYNDGDWVIVEAYDTPEDAQEGHNRWVAIMTSPDLPDTLTDCCNSSVSSMLEDVGGDVVFPRNNKKETE